MSRPSVSNPGSWVEKATTRSHPTPGGHMGLLSDHPVFPILLTRDLDASRAFYHGTLGLEVARVDHDRVVFRTGGGAPLVLSESTVGTSDTQTQAAWRVPDIAGGDRRAPVAWRADRGVRGARSRHCRRRRGHGPLVGGLVHRSEWQRPRGRPAEGLNGTRDDRISTWPFQATYAPSADRISEIIDSSTGASPPFACATASATPRTSPR